MSNPREIVAKIEHEQWESWAKSILLTEKISAERKQRWTECFVPYHKLSEEMKEHDRKWADKVLEAIKFDKLQQERDKLRADAEKLCEALEKVRNDYPDRVMANNASATVMMTKVLADFRKRWPREEQGE